MQAQCRIVPQAWDGMIPGLKVGKFDAIISSMSITKERARVVDFSDRYYSNVLTLIGAKNRQLNPTKDLHGLTISSYRSTDALKHCIRLKAIAKLNNQKLTNTLKVLLSQHF